MLFDDYEWPLESRDSALHPARGIDNFLSVLSEEVEIVDKRYQLLVRKKSDPIVDFPLVPANTIPVVIAVDVRTMDHVVSVLQSIQRHVSAPSQLNIVLVDCGVTSREAIVSSLTAPVTWVLGDRSESQCGHLLAVHDLCPAQYHHFVYVSSSAPLFEDNIAKIWSFAPGVVSFAAYASSEGSASINPNVIVVNRARFVEEARGVYHDASTSTLVAKLSHNVIPSS